MFNPQINTYDDLFGNDIDWEEILGYPTVTAAIRLRISQH